MKKILGFVAVAVLAACGGEKPSQSNQILHEGAPNWVNKGSGAFNGEKGRVFYGIGISGGVRNAALRRQDADSKARADIAATLNTYVTRLTKSYASSTTGSPTTAPSTPSPSSTWTASRARWTR